LPPEAQRIECFDVSHTMGERAVASCVIFDRLAMQSSEYRRFNVTPPEAGDDYAAMREALDAALCPNRRGRVSDAGSPRRRRREGTGGGCGRGACRAGTARHASLGIAKGPARKPAKRTSYFRIAISCSISRRIIRGFTCCSRFATSAPVCDPGTPARGGQGAEHLDARGDRGIGVKKRQALLAHFGGLKGVQAASIEDLTRVPGVSRALAEKIFGGLH
jgi:excinuclease ABC subunit C